jgi:hypothetical protein
MALTAAASAFMMHTGVSFSLTMGALVGFSGAFFVTRLLTIRLPQGDEVYVVAVVAVSALAVTSMGVALVASAVAGTIELMARLPQSSRDATRMRAYDIVRGTAVVGMLAPLQPLLHRLVAADASYRLIGAVVLMGCLYSLLDVLSLAVQQSLSRGLSLLQSVASLQRPLVTMYLVHLAMAAVGVQLYAASGAWALPITLLLTLILQNSFNLYLLIRRGYSETITALAHAAELDRPHDSGHAKRVSDLAVSVGRRLGLKGGELEQLGYAALLHDIGRMGDAESSSDSTTAERGAAIVASIPFLEDVAPLIRGQASSECDQLLACQIVSVCSRYDRLRSESGSAAAFGGMQTDIGEWASPVLAALREVVSRGHQRAGAVR